ncbi:hypothetical protein AOQ84DRAFT_436331 [Glonium stellatum]|uniref:Rhodopsin domain-containing protein n=1 Tax=Glonium stellatum TaxID=574774 RepID=A0A8E2JY53_9PEZI|nr:hypothetical protein AOQ84DRAFT_436331 [Glonium stellatum]
MAPFSPKMHFPTAILVVNSVGLALAFLAVVLRLWARRMRRVTMRLSDFSIIVAWLFAFALVLSENYTVTKGGVGQHQSTVTLDELSFSLKQFVVIGEVGTLAITFVKISALDLFISIFQSNQRFHQVAYILMGIVCCYGISYTIVSLAACRPFAAQWDKTIPGYKCIDTSAYYMSQCVIGAVLDCLVVALPMPMVWGLRLKLSKKIALTAIFGLGIFICAISIGRAVLNSKSHYMATDFPSYAGVAVLLGALEANLSIVNACLPLFQPILTNLAQKLRSSFSRSFLSRSSALTPSGSHESEKARGGFGTSAKRHRLADDDEDDKLRRLHDHLYPVSATGGSGQRGSFDVPGAVELAPRVGEQTAFVEVSDGTSSRNFDLEDLERLKLEPYSAIAVTKAWNVTRSDAR